MIPAPYHFRDIHREAWLHPDVEAEIEQARSRAGGPRPKRSHGFGALLRRILPEKQKRDWVRMPAE